REKEATKRREEKLKKRRKRKKNKFRELFGEARRIKLQDYGINGTESRRRFEENKKGLVNIRKQEVKPHRLITVTSRKDRSTRGTVGAGVDWTSFAKDSFSRYMNVCFTFDCVHGPYV
ncbi:unnamed protein product, partial [Brassica rapa subsp. trilocularis]